MAWAVNEATPLSNWRAPRLALVTRGCSHDGLVGVPSAAHPLPSPFVYLHCRRVLRRLEGRLLTETKRQGLAPTDTFMAVSDLFKGELSVHLLGITGTETCIF